MPNFKPGEMKPDMRKNPEMTTPTMRKVDLVRICTPTEEFGEPQFQSPCHESFRHLMPHLRIGKISAEAWSRRNRSKILVDPDVKEEGNASTEQTPTKVGLRRKRRSVGKKASLQQDKKKKTQEKKVDNG